MTGKSIEAFGRDAQWLDGEATKATVGRKADAPDTIAISEAVEAEREGALSLWRAIRSYQPADQTIVAYVHPDGSWDVWKPEVSRAFLTAIRARTSISEVEG